MNPIDAEALISRLPAFYRERDEALGGPLRALLAVMAEQGQVLLRDVQQLYDDAFVETCDESLLPYIGDLLGVLPMHGIAGTPTAGQRALIANTLRLRRRKGTLPVLEEVASAATGWRSSAMEMFQRLSTTQHVNAVRRSNTRMPDLRQALALGRLGGAFDTASFSADMRAQDQRGAGPRPNIAHVGLFLWRLSAYPVQRGTAAAVAGAPGRYTFDPLGRSLPLVNRPRTDSAAGTLAQPQDVPEPLSRRGLSEELAARREALARGITPPVRWFAPLSALPAAPPGNADGTSVLRVWLDDVEVPPEDLVICHLGDIPGAAPVQWRRPPASLAVGAITFPQGAAACLVGIDPVLGRLALPAGRTATRVEVAYAYAFPGDVGGGPYDRRAPQREDDAAQGLLDPTAFQTLLTVPGTHATLAAAVATVVPGTHTLIRLQDDRTHTLALALNLPSTRLAIEAANRRRPVLVGDVSLQGDGQTRLTLSGLCIDGALTLSGELRAVELRHCSLVPARGGLRHSGNAPGLEITLTHCLLGPLQCEHALAAVSADTCVIDAAALSPDACVLPDTLLTLNRCTVLGEVRCGELAAGHSLFDARVQVQRRQQGCVRFCYVPPGSAAQPSVTPRRYRCQPDMVTRGLPGPRAAAEALRVTPTFNATTFGDALHAHYTQLRSTTASEIRAGAENGAEMGVWNSLAQPQREANLRQALDEYLRFGLEAGALFAD
jgi:phage tail-like protein